MSGRDQWFKEQQELDRKELMDKKIAEQKKRFASKPEQMMLDLPIPREYQIECAYKDLVAACRYGQISGWDGSDYQNTARRLLDDNIS